MTIDRRQTLLGAALIGGGAALPAGARAATGDVWRIVRDTVVTEDIALPPGATIVVEKGATLAMTGAFQAPVARIFAGAGRVDLNRARITAVHPEWWGATTDDPAIDSRPALDAALLAHPVVRLGLGDYYISDTWTVARPGAQVTGMGMRSRGARGGTRLIVRSATADVLHVGPARAPGPVNVFVQNIRIAHLSLARDHLPVDEATGMVVRHVLFAMIDHVSAFEHATGFRIAGAVRSHLRNAVAFRSLGGDGKAWRGFHADGRGSIGLAGGNASLFLHDCNAAIGGAPRVADPVGLLIDGAFADTFVRDFETTGVGTGIRVDGRLSASGPRARAGQVNLHIAHPIIDQPGTVGIEMTDLGSRAAVMIRDPYVAVAPGARAAIALHRTGGSTVVSGGQLHGFVDAASRNGAAAGLLAEDSAGLSVTGLAIRDHRAPVALKRCRDCAVDGRISNPDHAASGPAVALDAVTGARIAASVTGRPRAFTVGVQATGACARIAVDATLIDPEAIAGARVAVPDAAQDAGA